MATFLRAISDSAQNIHDSQAPLDTDGARPTPAFLKQSLDNIDHLLNSDTPPFSLEDLPAYVDALKHLNTGIDDRKMLLEKVLVLMSRLPKGDKFSDKLQEATIDLFYKDLPHPPTYIANPPPLGPLSTPTRPGSTAKYSTYAFRSADGSNYNPNLPNFGAANQPYARTVPSLSTLPPSALPDPGVVFDTLLRRPSSSSGNKHAFKKHPGGISSLFFAFADIIIHSIFWTDSKDWTINKASSYLDLSPLYGSSEKDVESVRRGDGTGRLWEDVFADSRLLLMPPSVCALLVLLCRNHNYIATKLLDINERKTFVNPPPTDEKSRRAQDDELFHRARLINTGFFVQIIFGDYVGAILGLARDRQEWRLDPLKATRERDHRVSPRGEGNVISVEFNLLYRWHAALSEEDTKWSNDEFSKIFEGKPFDQVTAEDFKNGAHKYIRDNVLKKPLREWEFGGIQRDAKTGAFSSAALANILHSATSSYAGAFGARNTPEVMRVIEVLGMEQARAWGTCSLNEFRRFMGLRPYDNFEQWNPDPEVHRAAAALYKDIENLELHVGLQAEESKKPGPGAGLCPGYTISRAILADAVCLTRGDRFLTTEFTPYNLTSWGYQDCISDSKADGSFGGVLTKLLFRTLPEYYPVGSAYAHFPFTVPEYLKQVWHEKGLEKEIAEYTWTRPSTGNAGGYHLEDSKKEVKVEKVADTWDLVKNLLNSSPNPEDIRMRNIVGSEVKLDRELVRKVLLLPEFLSKWRAVAKKTTESLVRDRSIDRIGDKVAVKYVDVIRDVVSLFPVYFVANEIAGLPLKTEDNPRGTIREQKLYENFADVCNYVMINLDPEHDWVLRESSEAIYQKFLDIMDDHVNAINGGGIISKLADTMAHFTSQSDDSHTFIERLVLQDANAHAQGNGHGNGNAQGSRTKALVASVFAEIVPSAARFSHAIALVLDFFLQDSEERVKARGEIIKSFKEGTDGGRRKIMGYVREALRLSSPVNIVDRTVPPKFLGDESSGTRLFASVAKANLDPKKFGEDAKAPKWDRPSDDESTTGVLGLGDRGMLAGSFFNQVSPVIIGSLLSLPNIRRAPGVSGQFDSFTEDWYGTTNKLYINHTGKVTPFPHSLIIQYDG